MVKEVALNDLYGVVGDDGKVTDLVIDGQRFNLVSSKTNPLTGGSVFSAGGTADLGAGNYLTSTSLSAMQSAINAAGVGAKIVFPPNKTIVIRGALMPLSGQEWNLNGSTLKRHETQVVTTTSTAISASAGPTNLIVDDASKFQVGDGVYAYQGTTFETYPHSVSAVDYATNTLTIEGQWVQAFTGTTTIAQGGALIRHPVHGTDVPGVKIHNGILDDHFTTAAGTVNWATHCSVLLQSSHGLIENMELANAACEGFVVSGAGMVVRNNWIHDCGGNGIHFNGTGTNHGMEVSSNWIENTNLLGTAPGHADGSITISTPVIRSKIVNNVLINGIAAVGGYSTASYHSEFSGNVVLNMTTNLMKLYNSPTSKGINVTNNLFIDNNGGSRELTIVADSTTMGTVNISGNFFVNSRVLLDTASGVNIVGNSFVCTTPGASGVGQSIGLKNANESHISGNECFGYQRFVRVIAATGKDVSIIGNRSVDNYVGGIVFDTEFADVDVKDNTISVRASSTISASYVGINAKNKSVVQNNSIRIKNTTSGLTGITGAAGGASALAAIIDGNTVYVQNTGTQTCISLPASSQNNYVNGNYLNRAVVDNGTNTATIGANYVTPY